MLLDALIVVVLRVGLPTESIGADEHRGDRFTAWDALKHVLRCGALCALSHSERRHELHGKLRGRSRRQ